MQCSLNEPSICIVLQFIILTFKWFAGSVVGVDQDHSSFSFHIGKVRGNDGNISMANVMLAADDCVAAGANIISLAISCLGDASNRGCYKKQWEAQFDDIYNQGILIIGSVGNTGSIGMEYPGAYKTVLSVSAVNQSGFWFEESTQNDQTEIAAPGV